MPSLEPARSATLRDVLDSTRALGALGGRAVRPRGPDPALLRRLETTSAPGPRPTVTVGLRAVVQTRSRPLALGVAEGVHRPRRLELAMTTFVVDHPRARFLVDPAMCRDVESRIVPGLQAPLRWAVAPTEPVTGLAESLHRLGVETASVDFALPTHLHWDHVSGLADLPGLAVRTTEAERAHVLDRPTVPTGYVRTPLLGREMVRHELSGPPVLTFERSLDLFGDGSVVLVDLAGHTPGSVGILLAVVGDRRVLLAGDAVWHGEQVRRVREKGRFPGGLLDHDREAAFAVVHRLRALPPDVTVVAGHDHAAVGEWTA